MTDQKTCPKCGKPIDGTPVECGDGTVLYVHHPVHRDTPISYWDMTNTCGPVAQEDDDESR